MDSLLGLLCVSQQRFGSVLGEELRVLALHRIEEELRAGEARRGVVERDRNAKLVLAVHHKRRHVAVNGERLAVYLPCSLRERIRHCLGSLLKRFGRHALSCKLRGPVALALQRCHFRVQLVILRTLVCKFLGGGDCIGALLFPLGLASLIG